MAEIRKHNPDAEEGIAKLVRDALGETVRPVEPGQRGPGQAPVEDVDEADETSPTSVPIWDDSAPTYNF